MSTIIYICPKCEEQSPQNQRCPSCGTWMKSANPYQGGLTERDGRDLTWEELKKQHGAKKASEMMDQNEENKQRIRRALQSR